MSGYPLSGVRVLDLIAPPWKLSKTPASTTRPAPAKLGQDNDWVYRELIGLSDMEIAELEEAGYR